MKIIDIKIPYSIKEKKCSLVAYLDEEAFEAMLKDYYQSDVFAWSSQEGKYSMSVSFSHMISDEIWNIGGESKSSVDQWRISREIGIQGDIMETSFRQLYKKVCGAKQ